VVSGRAAAAGLPAIHPLAVVVELVWDEDGIGRLDQAILGREEFVVRGDHARAETGLLQAHPFLEGLFFRGAHDRCSMASSRSRSISWISRMAVASSSSLSLRTRCSKAARISLRRLPRTAITKWKPNFALYCSLSSWKRAYS